MRLSHNQTGFIQNFIIPGIILIGVVIAGIAMLASNSGGSDFSNEKAAMVANTLVGQGLVVSEALQRAQADGAQFPSGALNNAGTLVAARYLTQLPTPPKELASTGAYFMMGEVNVYDANGVAIGGVGGTPDLMDDVLLVDLGADVAAEQSCLRINNKVAGTPLAGVTARIDVADFTIEAAPGGAAGQSEGCGKTTSSPLGADRYVYYKVIRAKGNPQPTPGPLPEA